MNNLRRSFVKLIGMSLLFLLTGAKHKKRIESEGIIRPPGALKEKDFVNRCIRCGNCMRVCVTNGLQPVMFESGLEGILTPRLVPEIGYCEYQCTLCGQVCPTGAIPDLKISEKKKIRLGTAGVHRGRCLSWRGEENCLLCEEHCPVEEKAIKVMASKPVVDRGLCVGCGACQNVCPAGAITVNPATAIRT